jgi:tetratricopeptide (TPR) repeat protein
MQWHRCCNLLGNAVRSDRALWGGNALRIVILGSDTFAGPLRSLGHEVLTIGPSGDIMVNDPDPEWALVEKLLHKQGFEMDALIVTDNVGSRQIPTGINESKLVSVFYGVDSPLNRFWQEPYSQLFDLAFLDQADEAARLSKLHSNAHWLPVGIDPSLYKVEPAFNETPGVCFVGVVDENVRPKRSALLAKMAKHTPLVIRGGRKGAWFSTQEAANLYASHQVTLNENLFPGVTTRPLEVMASGGCLLTEAAPGSMDQFFNDQVHLSYFGPNNVIDRLEQLLEDSRLRATLRRRGRELVFENHTLEDRAQVIVDHIESVIRGDQTKGRVAGGDALSLEGETLLMAGLRWPNKSGKRRVLRGAARLRAAAADGAEPLSAARAAGLAELSLGRSKEALKHLQRAGALGGAHEKLANALAALESGDRDKYSQISKSIGITGYPGDYNFHLDAAKVLEQEQMPASIGFNRRALHPAYWTSLEHLLEATRCEQENPLPWERLGDLLMSQGAPNQAAQAYERACELKQGQKLELTAKIHEAAHGGYIL